MKALYPLLTIAFCLALVFSCDDEEIPGGNNKVELGSTTSSEISYRTVTVSTPINSINGNNITQHGHCWGTEANPEADGLHTSLGSLKQATTFSSNLENLQANTTYYVRSYLTTSNNETIYGTETTLKTLKTGKPVLDKIEITDVTVSSAIVRDSVAQDSGLVVLERGFCWHTEQTLDIENCLDSAKVGDGLGDFTYKITGLEDGKKYWVMAYAKNEAGISYGENKAIETILITIPIVTTYSVTELTPNSAKSGGKIENKGNAEITTCGVIWSTAENPTLENKLGSTSNGTENISFISELAGLQDGIKYYVRAYATNSKGTGYGSVIEFETPKIGLPIITSPATTDITTNSANYSTEVTSNGNAEVTERGVLWSKTDNPTLENNLDKLANGTGVGSFNGQLTDLEDCTTYYIRTYAINSEGTNYSTVVEFTTLCVTLPIVTSPEITDIKISSANFSAEVTSDGNAEVTERGVLWSKTDNPTLESNLGKISNGTGVGSFNGQLTDLKDFTTYYIRTFASNSKGNTYSMVVEFTTPKALPVVITSEISSITDSSVQCGGEVTSDGNATVTSRGICWSTSPSPTISDNKTVDGSGIGSFTSSIKELSPCQTYYLRAYATSNKGTGYGEQKSFIPQFIPSLIAPVNNAILDNGCADQDDLMTWKFEWDGCDLATKYHLYVKSSSAKYPVIDNINITDTKFIHSEAGYGAPGEWKCKVRAMTNGVWGSWSTERIFDLEPVGEDCKTESLPTITTSEVTDITPSTAQCGGNVTSDGNVTVTARGVCWSTSQNPTISGNKTEDGTGTGSFTSSITGLNSNTSYYVRAYATNSKGTGYGVQKVFKTPEITNDFYITNASVSPTTVAPGEQISISCDQNYDGNSSETLYPYVGYYLSSNTTLDSSDDLLFHDKSSLSSNDTSDGESANYNLPSNLSSGTYYILFVADYKGEYVETNENNNVAYVPITVKQKVFYATEDAQVYNKAPTTNYGDNESNVLLNVSGKTAWFYLKFDISSIRKNAVINEAKLRLYVDDVSNAYKINVYRVTSYWYENSLTWQNQPTINSTTISKGFSSSSKVWIEIDVTNFIGLWTSGYTNYGLKLIAPDETNEIWTNSRETSNKPQLIIRYDE